MRFPWRLYLAATLIGALAGLTGAAFHALLDQAAAGRGMLHGVLETAAVPGWLLLMPLCALVLLGALWLVRRFAPETAGSGVQEVEAILAGERRLRWQRVLPVKFVAGTLAVGSGLVLGREGPTIHMGAALGQMAGERLAPQPRERRALLAAGAAAGLATAFNAPLASIVFVTEELREHFEYRFATIQSVILACCAAVVVSGWMLGQGPDLPMPGLQQAPLQALPLFLVLGVLIGALGVLFNRLLLGSVAAFRALGSAAAYAAAGSAGLILGALLWFAPATVGGGESLVESLLHGQPALFFLLALLAVRLLTTVGSYGLGLPGGIFAPMLALGTLCGAAFAALVGLIAPALALDAEVFAVAAMGALFAATVRAPLTGIILVIELTGAQTLALPIILTCLSATFTAEGLGGRPIYSALLGLGTQPPPRAPMRRIAAAAVLLAALIAVERIEVARQGTGMGPSEPLAHARTPAHALTGEPAADSLLRSEEPRDRPYPPPAPIVAQRRRAETGTPEQDETDAAPGIETPPTRAALAEEQVSPAAGSPPAQRAPEASGLPPERAASGSDQVPEEASGSTGGAPPRAQPTATADPAPDTTARHGESQSEDSGRTARDAASGDATPARGADGTPADGPPARYSIQLISFREAASLTRFARDQGLLGEALKLASDDPSDRWHAVLLGAFADRAAAQAGLRELPGDLRRLDPLIRPLAPGERLVPIQAGAGP